MPMGLAQFPRSPRRLSSVRRGARPGWREVGVFRFRQRRRASCLAEVRKLRLNASHRPAFAPRHSELSTEPGSKGFFVEPGGLRQCTHPRSVLEVARAKPHHVLARDVIALRLDVHGTPPARATRIEHVGERNRRELTALDCYERARSTLEQIGDGGVAKIARVLGVERDRWRASQFVSDRLVYDRHLDAALFETHLDLVLDLPSEIDLSHSNVALRVAIDVLQFRHFTWTEAFDERL